MPQSIVVPHGPYDRAEGQGGEARGTDMLQDIISGAEGMSPTELRDAIEMPEVMVPRSLRGPRGSPSAARAAAASRGTNLLPGTLP